MSNPTSNYNWQMPTATDLVTDLPADFEVFGQAVDTAMADLLGGTSGQILAKNSNTNMDFVWITNDVGDITAVTAGTGISGGGTSGAVTITNSMATEITAKADLIVGTGNAAFDNLPVGANGTVLTADSTVSPTGLKWATPATPASGLTFITSSTFSNVASASITGCFTSTYYNYLVTFQDMGAATANDDLEMVFITAVPADSTSHYGGFIFLNIDTPVISSGSFKAAAKIKLTSSTGLLTNNDYGSGFMYVSQVGVSGRPRINGQYINNAEGYPTFFGAMVGATATFTGMKFSTSSSNITGKISVYGLAVS